MNANNWFLSYFEMNKNKQLLIKNIKILYTQFERVHQSKL